MFVIDEIQKVWFLIILQFKQIFIYWILGVIAGSFLSVYAFPGMSRFISRFKNEKYSFFVALIAALMGVASPICMYGTIPLIAALRVKGVPQYVLATFMVSSILLNPNLFLFSFALGAPIALFRLFSCIVVGMMAGGFVKIFYTKRELFKHNVFEDSESAEKKKKRFLQDLHKAITITAPYFIIGVLLSALFEQYIPKQFIVSLFGQNKGLGVLFATSLGVPLYVCGGGTIPLLKVWLESGMTAGAAIAFMISGPATKITNLGAVKIILGMKNFVLYIAFNMVAALMMGVLANMVIVK
jgi:uncharacterized membrane protein YraQ (UPF0718 family)